MHMATRNGVTDMDRYEQILASEPKKRGVKFDGKFLPKPIRKKYGERTIGKSDITAFPSSIRTMEDWDETAPICDFEARMRANDSDAPFNVRTGSYLPRHTDRDLPASEPTLFTKRGFHASGPTHATRLGPAPWRHSSGTYLLKATKAYENQYCLIFFCGDHVSLWSCVSL